MAQFHCYTAKETITESDTARRSTVLVQCSGILLTVIIVLLSAGCSGLMAAMTGSDGEARTERVHVTAPANAPQLPTGSPNLGGNNQMAEAANRVVTSSREDVVETALSTQRSQTNTERATEKSGQETLAAARNCPAPAFPTAEGFGALARGGRGGQVIEVTNLNSEGPGSLRAAIETKGPRIVVFRVGGTIELTERLRIKEPYLTIAGQSAPGGGITLKSSGVDRDLVKISTHNIVIRYIRVRPGPGGDSGGITIDGGETRNVILDHMSISWSVDENLTTWYDNANITIQWSIIAEGLNNSSHSEGPHSKGLMLGADGSRNLSIHHNLLAHNVERSPRIKTSGLVDFRNNVIYNYGVSAGWVTNEYGDVSVNYVGNYIKPGPNSDRSRYGLEIDSVDDAATISVFVDGNLSHHRLGDTYSQNVVVKEDGHQFLVDRAHPAPPIVTTNAETAYEQVLENAGATIPMRDEVDTRIVQEVLSGTGRIIDDPSQVGGWPQLAAGMAPVDNDHDGMADSWESTYDLDTGTSADNRLDPDDDGYTNVEEYLNNTNPLVADLHPAELCVFVPLIITD